MKNIIGIIITSLLLTAGSAMAQQATNPAAGTNVAGTGNTTEQYNAAAGRPAGGGRTSTSTTNNNGNGLTPTAGTGNTLDQNQAISAGSPAPGTAPVETKTKTDNTHSVISGHSTDVKAKKRNPKKKNTEQRNQP
jgi:hypothetical protein